MVRFILIPLVILCSQALYLYGQNVDADKEIEQYLTSILKNDSYNLSSGAIKNAEPLNILRLANQNISNANAGIRYKIIDLVKRKAVYISDASLRMQYAYFLTVAIKDPDSGNSGVASKSLTKFTSSDFSQATKDTLYALLTRKTYHYEQIVKLSGFLNSEPAKEFLKSKLLNDSTLTPKNKWTYHLALARMGNDNSIEYCLNKAKAMPVNDNTVTYLFPDLAYTRQPQCLKYVLDQIVSDAKNCNSPNPETDDKIICAYKIMEIVAPVIADFPIKVDKYGDLEINNQDEALASVRNWITNNKEFNLLNEIY